MTWYERKQNRDGTVIKAIQYTNKKSKEKIEKTFGVDLIGLKVEQGWWIYSQFIVPVIIDNDSFLDTFKPCVLQEEIFDERTSKYS